MSSLGACCRCGTMCGHGMMAQAQNIVLLRDAVDYFGARHETVVRHVCSCIQVCDVLSRF
jgi:hypothetical protein